METVKLTNRKVLDVMQGLNSLGDYVPPSTIRIKLTRIMRVLKVESAEILEERQAILEKYAVYEGDPESPNRRYKQMLDREGKPVPNSVELTNKKAFNEEEKALYDAEVEVAVPLLTMEELEQMEISLAAQELIWDICKQ